MRPEEFLEHKEPIAYLDESSGGSIYLMAAVVVADRNDQRALRHRIQDVLSQTPYHAVQASEQEREALETLVTRERGIRALVTVCAPITDSRHTETARQRCLATLATELHAKHGVTELWMDSRDDLTIPASQRSRQPNLIDRQTINDLREKSGLEGLTIKFRQDTREPLLWAADAVGWRTRRALVNNDLRQLERLAPVVELKEARVLPHDQRHQDKAEEHNGLQYHLNLMRAQLLAGIASREATYATLEGADDAEAYARTAKAAAERLDVMTQQLQQARQSGQARDIYHYVAHSGRQPNQQRGLDMA